MVDPRPAEAQGRGRALQQRPVPWSEAIGPLLGLVLRSGFLTFICCIEKNTFSFLLPWVFGSSQVLPLEIAL